jgi:hypothetical protein
MSLEKYGGDVFEMSDGLACGLGNESRRVRVRLFFIVSIRCK